jgi:hypothetical protein
MNHNAGQPQAFVSTGIWSAKSAVPALESNTAELQEEAHAAATMLEQNRKLALFRVCTKHTSKAASRAKAATLDPATALRFGDFVPLKRGYEHEHRNNHHGIRSGNWSRTLQPDPQFIPGFELSQIPLSILSQRKGRNNLQDAKLGGFALISFQHTPACDAPAHLPDQTHSACTTAKLLNYLAVSNRHTVIARPLKA